ncbi:MAG: prolyl oligopeptidase family serine peptidase [Chloroflexota bacterium]|nr:prolyl oligopeptidase family serine peptidase [Chloroflexota bacterium]
MPLQRVSFPVPTGQLDGALHLPEREAIGGCAVLHGFGGDPDQPHVVATCDALAASGVAALRFAFRDHEPPRMTIDSALEDAVGALRLLRVHPQVAQRYAVVGFSFGGAVAALAAGRDHRIAAAVLAAAPSMTRGGAAGWTGGGKWRPVAELSHTRARVLLVWGTEDTQVPFADAESYDSVLSQARVTHRVVRIAGGDHDFEPETARERMTATVAEWIAQSFTAGRPA